MKKITFRYLLAIIALIIGGLWFIAVLSFGRNDAGPFLGLAPILLVIFILIGYLLGGIVDLVKNKF